MASTDILTDQDSDWSRIPFAVNIGETAFDNVASVVAYRTAHYGTGIISHDDRSFTTNPESAANFLGLKETVDEQILGRPFYQDTRVGGNEAINCLWQFNRDDDIVHMITKTNDGGEGRVYASTTQLNQTVCWFTFGVPYFTPLARFYKNAFNDTLIELNNNGWTNNTTPFLGRLFGFTGTLALVFPLLPIKWLVELSRINANNYRIDRFYELRGRMQLYYEYVDGILAHWLVAAGLYGNKATRDYTFGISSAAVEAAIPPALKATGANIWDIVKRRALAAGLENDGAVIPSASMGKTRAPSIDLDHPDGIAVDDNSEYDKMIKETLFKEPKDVQEWGDTDWQGEAMGDSSGNISSADMYSEGSGGSGTSEIAGNKVSSNNPFASQLNLPEDIEKDIITEKDFDGGGVMAWADRIGAQLAGGQGGAGTDGSNPNGGTSWADAWNDRNGNWIATFKNAALGATQFIGFRITRDTDASESFSNSTSPSEFAESYNSKVRERQAKNITMGLSGGKIHIVESGGSSIGNFMQSVAQDVASLAQGALDALKSVDFLGITDMGSAVFKGAYLDIPEQYSSSDFNKSHSITLQLRAPYGDLVSIYQSIIVPLACILAGALPRAGGSNSYTQPFLCRVYCQGRFSVPMGIIESVSIKRGDSEYGWTYDSLPTAVDVSISIKDMSPIMYMAMAAGSLKSIWGADNAFNEYILTLAGAGLFDRISSLARFLRNIQYDAHIVRQRYFNPAFWSHRLASNSVVQFVASAVPRSVVSSN